MARHRANGAKKNQNHAAERPRHTLTDRCDAYFRCKLCTPTKVDAAMISRQESNMPAGFSLHIAREVQSRVGQLNIQIFGHGKPISFTYFPDYGHLGPVCDVKPYHPPVTDISGTGEVRTAWRNVGNGSGNMLPLGRLQCCGQCRNLGGIAFGYPLAQVSSNPLSKPKFMQVRV